ncbi:MAG: hypothetical protein FJZ62_01575 [Chlamydiae bacterium]|nr:hypothetical protein [Chlamydiota bacterium]
MFSTVSGFLKSFGNSPIPESSVSRAETPSSAPLYDPSRDGTPLANTPLSTADTPVDLFARSATPASPTSVGESPRSFFPFMAPKNVLLCPKPKKMPRMEDIAKIITEIFTYAGSMPETGIDEKKIVRKSRHVIKEDGSTVQRDFFVYKGSPLIASSEVFAFVAVELEPSGATQNFIYSKLKAATKHYTQATDPGIVRERFERALPFYKQASSMGVGPETLVFQKDGVLKPHQTLSRLANRGDLFTLVSLSPFQAIDLEDEVLYNFGTQLMDKLIRLHQTKIVHGDIKPENVLFHQVEGNQWQVFICDYGYATDLSEAPNIGLKDKGTALYLPPEFDFTNLSKHLNFNVKDYVSNRLVDLYKADSYALGLTLFVMLFSGGFKENLDSYYYKRRLGFLSQVFSREQVEQISQILNVSVETVSRAKLSQIFSHPMHLKQAIDIRTILVEDFIDKKLKSKFPAKAEVIKGLLKQNPDERWSLEKALEEWIKKEE